MFRLCELVISVVETSSLRDEIRVRGVSDRWEEFVALVGQDDLPVPVGGRRWRDRVTKDNAPIGTAIVTEEVWPGLSVGLQPEYYPPWLFALSQREVMRSFLARGTLWVLEEVRAPRWCVHWQPEEETVVVNSVTAGAHYTSPIVDVPPASHDIDDWARLGPVSVNPFVILLACATGHRFCGTVYVHDETNYCHCCQTPVKLRAYGPAENRLQPALKHVGKVGHKECQFNEAVHEKGFAWRIYPYFWISHSVFKTGSTACMLMDHLRSPRLHPALQPLAHAMQSELSVDVHSGAV
ncbi:hypothetical protein Pmar_PMAR008816 [Perkinsus marinus ATCC 50983]|uniref:Uncharacterized protein n=1 Tax=Perkinsus marinus (strain ATCC 50983 / TXsc) TaxID=423536 RepID=C5KDF4_PERM5|nr:hypothetical protein Pmar_PMAR008816 [Perkinsus marinus ATCC 50983]EER17490.1 hypothetical protein Pmar_PMAR008816 [Perkinsus marinus ATCC 50983]|eukprot:XP_002785694.1 hypothetical protein Pmar_PMAR008816 [Perkinsus marinus ATCC 50983]